MRPLLTIDELADWLSMTPGAIRTARYRNPESMPPAIKIGRQLRWDPDAVETWLTGHAEHTTTVLTFKDEAPAGVMAEASLVTTSGAKRKVAFHERS